METVLKSKWNLKESRKNNIGVVADIIKVDKKYEVAIETAFRWKYSEYCN